MGFTHRSDSHRCFVCSILITNDSSDDEDFQVWIYPTTESLKLIQQLILLGFCFDHYYSLEGK